MSTIEMLYQYMCVGDSKNYIELKYQHFQEGDNVIFEGKDFSNLDLSGFALPFTIFKNCILDNVKISGSPVGFKNSKAAIDLRDSSGAIIAEDTDFTGTKFNDDTSFQNSYFSRCVLEDDFKEFLNAQGAIFTDQDVIASNLGNQ